MTTGCLASKARYLLTRCIDSALLPLSQCSATVTYYHGGLAADAVFDKCAWNETNCIYFVIQDLPPDSYSRLARLGQCWPYGNVPQGQGIVVSDAERHYDHGKVSKAK
jgi:hypothetical protein